MDLVLNGMEEMNEQELMMVDGGFVPAVVVAINAAITVGKVVAAAAAAYATGYAVGQAYSHYKNSR